MANVTEKLVAALFAESFIIAAGTTLGVFSTLVLVVLPFTKRFTPTAYADITGRRN